MSKLFIIFILGFILADKVAAQGTNDWKTLTITKFCTGDNKYCKNKMIIENNGLTRFEPCEQKIKVVKIEESLIKKLITTDKNKIKHWRANTSIDTTCGYLIVYDDSDEYYVVFDNDKAMYDQQDIKDYIMTLNEVFKKLK